jgi:ribosomal protein S18 acetylase RimI-like enzyme
MTGLTYFKRYRMELDLRRPLLPVPALPRGYAFVPWDDGLITRHAEVKWLSFRGETDTQVFPSLGDYGGCIRLMEAIRYGAGFCPEATWLLSCGLDFCGTVQGIVDARGRGAIQNVGVVVGYRRQGFGKALLLKSLHGFKNAGVRKVGLEVTACNAGAVKLYRGVGFRARRSLYKAANTSPDSVAEPALVR